MSTEEFPLLPSRELDRVIAEKLGWRAVEAETTYPRYDPPRKAWMMQDPDGKIYHLYNHSTPEGAWKSFASTDDECLIQCDYYSLNTDVAMSILKGDMRLSLHNEDYPLWTAVIWMDTDVDDEDFMTNFVANAETPALAICRAALFYFEHMEKRDARTTNLPDPT